MWQLWQQIVNLLKLAFTFAEKLQRMEANLKEQGQLIQHLMAEQTRLHYESQLQRERDARERQQDLREVERRLYEHRHAEDNHEKELLRLENRNLHAQLESQTRLSLPAAPAEKKVDEE